MKKASWEPWEWLAVERPKGKISKEKCRKISIEREKCRRGKMTKNKYRKGKMSKLEKKTSGHSSNFFKEKRVVFTICILNSLQV